MHRNSYIHSLNLALLLAATSFSVQAQTSATKAMTTPAAPTSKAAVAIAPAMPSAGIAKTNVDLAKSSVSAVFKQTGVAVEGQFHKFSMAISFDPAKIAETKAQVDIDMTSYDIGDAAYNSELLKKEWFNTAQFPKASFVASAVKAIAPGKLEVTGKLTIKGKTVDATMPVTYKQEANTTIFEGILPIKRLSFTIGDGEWKDTSVVEDEVKIKFKVTLVSAK